MKRGVVWTWGAEVDAQEAFAYLDGTSDEGGARFVVLTDRLVELLQSFPYLAPIWQAPVRRALIRRSNYGLFYVIEPTRLVVIGIQDLRRDPDRLKQDLLRRLPE